MTASAQQQQGFFGHVQEAIDEWNGITGPTKSLAGTIVSRLIYEGYSLTPAKNVVADTYDKAAHIAQYAADESEDQFDRDTCEALAANFLDRARAIRRTGPSL